MSMSLPNPAETNVFASAVDWLAATVLGTLASTVAILAVASIGLLLLTGRIDVRRAVQVILGCFVLFGASTIASGIMGALSGSGSAADMAMAAPPPAPVYPPVAATSTGTPNAFDPYAGAALPGRP